MNALDVIKLRFTFGRWMRGAVVSFVASERKHKSVYKTW